MSTITRSSIEYITQMLHEPLHINDADLESIGNLKKEYPYFVPVRYMEAAARHKDDPFSPKMMSDAQLYMGNWLLFCQYMESALDEEQAAQLKQKDKSYSINAVYNPEEEDNFGISSHEEPEDITETTPEEEEKTYNQTIRDEVAAKEDFLSPRHLQSEQSQQHVTAQNDDTLILPIYTEDYFFHQGIDVSNEIPKDAEAQHVRSKDKGAENDRDKSLMVVMSFSEWLLYFKVSTEKEKEEKADKKALKTMWQKEKLAAAMEEENEEIPENVFEMAVNSITREESLISEPLAEIYIKQGKYDTAIEMYRKLSLRNPQKSGYFARKIEAVLKEKHS